MARLVVSATGFDMSSWDLSDIADGTVTSGGATAVNITGEGGTFVYQLRGTGLGDFDTDGFPHSGTITEIVMKIPGQAPLVLSHVSLAADDFMSFADANDAAGLEAVLFSDRDSLRGGAGDDVLIGLGGADSFNLSKGGVDTVQGGDGDDIINAGGALTAADSVDGGAGTDKLVLAGDYSGGLTFAATTMTNVEAVVLSRGHSYTLTFDAANDMAGQSLEVYGAKLASSQVMNVDASALAGSVRLVGGAGDDVLMGGSGAAALFGGDGNDNLGLATWVAGDRVHGGAGTNTLTLNGDFSAGLVLNANYVSDVQALAVAAGHSYALTDDDLALTKVDASALGAGDSLHFDGSQDTAGHFAFIGGAGDDVLIGAPGNTVTGNTFDMSHGGDDTVTGGTGIDTFNFGTTLDLNDTVNGGGGGNDTLNATSTGAMVLGANIQNINHLAISAPSLTIEDGLASVNQNVSIGYSGNLLDLSAVQNGDFTLAASDNETIYGAGGDARTKVTLLSPTTSHATITDSDVLITLAQGDAISHNLSLTNCELDLHCVALTLDPYFIDGISGLIVETGKITTVDADVAAGARLMVQLDDGTVFNGQAETDGAFDILSSRGGKAYGGDGNDAITATRVAAYHGVADSTSVNFDTIQVFDFALPQRNVFSGVSDTGTNAQASGSVSMATFDSDLAAIVTGGTDTRTVVTVSGGDLAGDTFLVIDENGVAGYQAGQDYVFRLVDCKNIDQMSNADFGGR